jgi:hypothetical protein
MEVDATDSLGPIINRIRGTTPLPALPGTFPRKLGSAPRASQLHKCDRDRQMYRQK